MPSSSHHFVLPRPGGVYDKSAAPIPAPSEAAFTSVFGTLLPPVKYLDTSNGKAAYYDLPPVSSHQATTPERVLLIHGVQTPAIGMLPLARAFRVTYPHAHFVLFDLWGHGLTDTPIAPHDKALFHQLIDGLLDHLGWATAHLIGYSFGGVLTTGYVATRKERVQSFVLIAPAGLMRASNFTAQEQDYLREGVGGDEIAAAKFIQSFLEGGDRVVPAGWEERVARGEIVAEAVREWESREHPGHNASVVGVFRDAGVLDNDSDFVDALKTGIPSVAVLGESDEVCSEKDLHQVGFTNVHVVPQVGHGVVRERATDVAAIISAFWKKLEGVGA